MQFQPGAILPHSNTPSLRATGFEDETTTKCLVRADDFVVPAKYLLVSKG